MSKTPQEKRAERELASILEQFNGKKSLLQLLPVIKLRYPMDVLLLAVKRIERKIDDLPIEDRIFFEGFKKTLPQG